MTGERASWSPVCRKLCADACGVRSRATRGGACCRSRLSERRLDFLSQKRCKAGFFLRRMEWKERKVWRTVRNGSNGIAEGTGSGLYGLESDCDALVDQVWMVKEEEDRVIIFFAPGGKKEGWGLPRYGVMR